jgi:hypothetical protein
MRAVHATKTSGTTRARMVHAEYPFVNARHERIVKEIGKLTPLYYLDCVGCWPNGVVGEEMAVIRLDFDPHKPFSPYSSGLQQQFIVLIRGKSVTRKAKPQVVLPTEFMGGQLRPANQRLRAAILDAVEEWKRRNRNADRAIDEYNDMVNRARAAVEAPKAKND